MKKILMLIAITFVLYSCSESTSPSKTGQVNIVSEMPVALVSIANQEKPKDSPEASSVDSIKITNFRILLSELKLHPDESDSSNEKVMKAGPFVYNVDSTGTIRTIASGSVPSGNYNKIKMEFHRFSSSEYAQYANDAILKDFATSDRYSVIINGIAYKNGNGTRFTFKAQTTTNIELYFPSLINITDGSNTTITMKLDPSLIFKNGSTLYDPNDTSISNKIENNIKSAFKSMKK